MLPCVRSENKPCKPCKPCVQGDDLQSFKIKSAGLGAGFDPTECAVNPAPPSPGPGEGGAVDPVCDYGLVGAGFEPRVQGLIRT